LILLLKKPDQKIAACGSSYTGICEISALKKDLSYSLRTTTAQPLTSVNRLADLL
jgi:hypothetical protein